MARGTKTESSCLLRADSWESASTESLLPEVRRRKSHSQTGTRGRQPSLARLSYQTEFTFFIWRWIFPGRRTLSSIYVGSLNSNEKRLITQAKANAAYAEPGYLLFYRDQTLFAQRFDAKKLELNGEPSPILTDIQYLPRIQRAVFASSESGVLVAQRTGDTGSVATTLV